VIFTPWYIKAAAMALSWGVFKKVYKNMTVYW